MEHGNVVLNDGLAIGFARFYVGIEAELHTVNDGAEDETPKDDGAVNFSSGNFLAVLLQRTTEVEDCALHEYIPVMRPEPKVLFVTHMHAAQVSEQWFQFRWRVQQLNRTLDYLNKRDLDILKATDIKLLE